MPGVNLSQLVAEAATELIAETKMKVEDKAEFSLLMFTKVWFESKDGNEEEVKERLKKVFKAAQARAADRRAQAVEEEDIKAVAAKERHG